MSHIKFTRIERGCKQVWRIKKRILFQQVGIDFYILINSNLLEFNPNKIYIIKESVNISEISESQRSILIKKQYIISFPVLIMWESVFLPLVEILSKKI